MDSDWIANSLSQINALLDHTKSISDFRLSVRAAVRGLWNGEFSTFYFVDTMRAAIERNLKRAWVAGAAECGIKEDELSDGEIAARDRLIDSQFPYLLGFAGDIEENSKASGGLLGPHLERAEMWVRKYDEAKNQANVMACGDKKLKWIYGDTEHCEDCNKLNGKVYRASIWAKYGIRPQSKSLACGGWRCKCTLQPTGEPATKGRPPGLKGPKKKR